MRPLFIVVIAALEATLISLPLTALTWLNTPWLLLFAVVLAGRFADVLALRVAPQAERPVLLGMALLTVLAALLSYWAGNWQPALNALLPGAPGQGSAYAIVLVSLFLFWRGTRLSLHTRASVMRLVNWGAGLALLTLLFAPLIEQQDNPAVQGQILAHLLAYIGAGLLGLALAHADADADEPGQRRDGRWIAAVGMAIGVLLLLGAAISASFGGDMRTALLDVLAILLFPLVFVGGLLTEVMVLIFGDMLRWALQVLSSINLGQNLPTDPTQNMEELYRQIELTPVGQAVSNGLWVLGLLPLLLIVALLVLLRRRNPSRPPSNEVRESLGGWQALSSDLRDLLSHLHFSRQMHGLRAALAALKANDPSSRVRRAYIRLLLALEERQHPRPPAHTPAEFAAETSATLPDPQPIATLTASYERARYSPGGANLSDAEQAEAAVHALTRSNGALRPRQGEHS